MTDRTDSMTSRTQGWDARTTRPEAVGPRPRRTVEEFRRGQADKAIARIEECYRRGLAIPDIR